MAENAIFEKNHSIFWRIKDDCEKLVNETQSDLTIFRQEQEYLRQQIIDVMSDNRALSAKLDAIKRNATSTVEFANGNGGDKQSAELTNEAINLLHKRIASLKAENIDLKSLHTNLRRTIEHLEIEIKTYKDHVFAAEPLDQIADIHQKEIQDLNERLENLNLEVEEKNTTIEKLLSHKRQYEEYIIKLQTISKEKDAELSKFKDQDSTIKGLEERIQETDRRTKEAEVSLRAAKLEIDDRFQRERNALQKVKEALSIAEVAVAEKEAAENKHQVLKEEWDNLASTIGQVMEEAARKADKHMDELRQKFLGKEEILKHNNGLLDAELKKHTKLYEMLEARCQRFEKKYKEAVKENERLKTELKAANKTLQQVLHSNKAEVIQKPTILKAQLSHLNEVQSYVKSNNNIKEKYKTTIQDLTDKFTTEINRLTNENTKLRAQIEFNILESNQE